MPKGMHNPLPASLGSECKKATQILDSFINGSWRGSPGRELPARVLREAKGVAILTVTKAGMLGSVRFGSGILIARLPDEPEQEHGPEPESDPSAIASAQPTPQSQPQPPPRWSPPSAISTFGLGFGGQAGFELTDFVFIFTSLSSLEAFTTLGSLTLSGNISIAFGPLGRNAEIAGGVSGHGAGKMMSFAKTKGLFGGVSVEGGVLVERRGANRRFYGDKGVTAGGILGGKVEIGGKEEIEGLMRVLGQVFGDELVSAVEHGDGNGSGEDPVSGTAVAAGSTEQPVSEAIPEQGPEPQPAVPTESRPAELGQEAQTETQSQSPIEAGNANANARPV